MMMTRVVRHWAARAALSLTPGLALPLGLLAAEGMPTGPRVDSGGEREVVTLEAFAVTGSNIRRTDLETVQPVTRIETGVSSGQTGTPLDLLLRVPVLGSLSVYENQDGGRVRGSASSVNLRGLGGQHTLMLLNGRRLPSYAMPFGGLVFSNVNNLPLAAVERVEILRDGASATYGADATAGVVNFITKRNANERHLGIRFGDTDDGAASEHRATFTYGQRFQNGRGGFLFVADAFHREMMMARDRRFAVLGDLRGRVPEPFGSAAIWNTLTNLGPYASFTLVTQSGLPNALPGLGGTAAYVDFGGTLRAGTRAPANYYNDARDFSLMPGRDSRDVFVSGDYRVTKKVKFFAELSYNDVESKVQQSPMTLSSTQSVDAAGNPLVLPASNYYNPFGTRFYGPGTANPSVAPRAVQFSGLEPALGLRTARITTSQQRYLAGLRGEAGGKWTWETGLLYASNRARDLTHNLIKLSALSAALSRTTPDAFNFFAGPGANSEVVLAPLRTDSFTGGTSELKLWDAKASGEVIALPAGALQAALGVEYRGEGVKSDYAPVYRAADLAGTPISTDFDAFRTTRAAYLEFSAPLLRGEYRPVFRKAELQVAVRHEVFTSFGSATKPRYGLSSMILPGLLLRGSYGQGFRAPSLTQLFGGVSSSTSNRADVFRPQEGTIRRFIFQPPNAALKPENTESRNVGFVWEVPWIRGLSLGIDRWRYDLKDQINVIPRLTQLAIEAAGGAYSNPFIVRAAPTPTEPIGPILRIIEPLANYQSATTSGADLNVSYRLGRREKGLFTFTADGTYVDAYRVKLDPSQPEVSFPNDLGRPRFRGTGQARYARRAWSTELSYQYTSHYNPPDRVTVGGRDYWIPSYASWNASGSYSFGRVLGLRDLTVSVGVNNLLNDDPPLYPSRQGYDARLASPQGRFLYLNVGLDF